MLGPAFSRFDQLRPFSAVFGSFRQFWAASEIFKPLRLISQLFAFCVNLRASACIFTHFYPFASLPCFCLGLGFMPPLILLRLGAGVVFTLL